MELFQEDLDVITKKKIELENYLKGYFENRLKNGIARKSQRELQNKISTWQNLCGYITIKSHSRWSQISERINKLFIEYQLKLDTAPDEFKERYPMRVLQHTFELVMADFISKKYSLKNKKGPPDLVLEHENCFVEVTTRVSSLMDKFDKLLPFFDKFYNIAEELFKLNNDWCTDEDLDTNLTNVYCELKLQPHEDINEAKKQFKEWLEKSLYAFIFFKEILPDDFINKLKSIGFSQKGNREIRNKDSLLNFFYKAAIDTIITKLKKPYFREQSLGFIAISFTNLSPQVFDMMHLTRIIIQDDFFYHFNQLLNDAIKEKDSNEQKLILNGLKNLYGILFDPTWYNWFPEISGSNFRGLANKNCYRIIYNEKIFNSHINIVFFDMVNFKRPMIFLKNTF